MSTFIFFETPAMNNPPYKCPKCGGHNIFHSLSNATWDPETGGIKTFSLTLMCPCGKKETFNQDNDGMEAWYEKAT